MASDLSFGTDVDQVIKPALNLARAALEAAARVPTIKRFVQTASSASAVKSELPPGTPHDLPLDHFNTHAIEVAHRPDGAQDPAQPMWVYSASKVLQEQAVWKWRDEHKDGLHFGINTVLPDYVIGEILSVDNQGYPSSLSALRPIWDGDLQMAQILPPQYEIDAKDVGMLHVAALLHPDVDGERIFGFAFPKNLTTIIQYLRELYPDKTFPDPPAGDKEYLGKVEGQARAEELLKWVKGSGWTGFKESLKEVGDTLL